MQWQSVNFDIVGLDEQTKLLKNKLNEAKLKS